MLSLVRRAHSISLCCLAETGGFVEVAVALDHGLVPVLPLESLSVAIYEDGLL